GDAGPLPEGRAGGAAWHNAVHRAPAVHELSGSFPFSSRGVLVAGGGITSPWAVAELSECLGWPILADPRSGCRVPGPATVATVVGRSRCPGPVGDRPGAWDPRGAHRALRRPHRGIGGDGHARGGVIDAGARR